VPEPEEPG
jgi:hypothetical protein